MEKPSLSSYIRDNVKDDGEKQDPGPFVTISRQFGCDGYEVGDLLAKRLNEMAGDEKHQWQVFKREILKQVAEDSGISEEVIERERQNKPSLFRDFFRALRGSKMPDSFEILKSITTLVRRIAFDGHAIIVGHGATAATSELENGINIRIEAPREWRLRRLCSRDGLSAQEAENLIKETETGRKHLNELYKKWNPRTPAFCLVLDNSLLSSEDMVEHVIMAMKQRKLCD